VSIPVAPRRVTIVGPTARVDVSLPPQSRVAELVPVLARLTAGGRTGTGWTLGRLGGDALDGSSTVAAANVQDGELLYLHPREAQPAPPVFDDVVDAIATAAGAPQATWRPALSRTVGLAAALVTFGGAAVIVAAMRPQWPTTAAVCGLLAFVLLLAAAAVARSFGDPGAGGALAGAGIPASALAGIALVTPSGADPFGVGAAGLAAGSAVLALYAVVAAVAVAEKVAWFAAAALAATAGCAAALVTILTGVRPSAVAAAVTAGALVLSPILPMMALRLGRLPLPRVPSDPTAFRRDDSAAPGPEVAERTRTAAALLAGMLAAVAVLSAGASAVLLASASGPWVWALSAAAGLAMLLRARAYPAIGPRTALLTGGAVTLAATGVNLAAHGSAMVGVALVLAVLGTGVVCLAYGMRAPAERPSPYWTRLLDVLEFVALVGLVPLAGAVIGWYDAARSLGG